MPTPIDPSLLAVLLGALLLVGLAAAWLARKSAGRAGEVFFQRLFYALLGLVGAGTIAALGLGPNYWFISGGTLSLMVLTVTCDFRPRYAG